MGRFDDGLKFFDGSNWFPTLPGTILTSVPPSALPSTTTLTSSNSQIDPGTTITLTADTSANVGSIQFEYLSGSTWTAIGIPVPVNASGIATITHAPTVNITYRANYLATGGFLASTSNSVIVGVAVATTTTLVASPTTISYGSVVTLTATSTGVGSVQFESYDGSAWIAVGAVVSIVGGTAVKTVTPDATSTYRARYITTSQYLGSTSNSVIVTLSVVQVTITLSAPDWDLVNINWTAPNFPVSSYILKHSGTVIYSGPALGYGDTLRLPATPYNYSIEAQYAGTTKSTASSSITTPGWGWSYFTASPDAWNLVRLRWAPSNQKSVDQFIVYKEQCGWCHAYNGGGWAHDDWSVGASTFYRYHLYAYRSGMQIGGGIEALATTPGRPTNSGTVTGPGPCGGCYQWKQSTAVTVTASWGVPRDCYVSSIDMDVSGYGTTGWANPQVHGSYKGRRDIGSTSTGSPGWNNFDMGNHYSTPGTATLGFKHDASPSSPVRKTQWNYSVHDANNGTKTVCYKVHYWWYTAMAEREIQEEVACDADGIIVSRWTWDKETGDLLEQMGPDPRTWYDDTTVTDPIEVTEHGDPIDEI